METLDETPARKRLFIVAIGSGRFAGRTSNCELSIRACLIPMHTPLSPVHQSRYCNMADSTYDIYYTDRYMNNTIRVNGEN